MKIFSCVFGILVLSLLVIVMVAVDAAPPVIAWEYPTPPDGSTTQNNWVLLNTTITDDSYTSAFFDWEDSLVGYWSFDEGSGDEVNDKSTYGNDGRIEYLDENLKILVIGDHYSSCHVNSYDDHYHDPETGTDLVPDSVDGIDLEDFDVILWRGDAEVDPSADDVEQLKNFLRSGKGIYDVSAGMRMDGIEDEEFHPCQTYHGSCGCSRYYLEDNEITEGYPNIPTCDVCEVDEHCWGAGYDGMKPHGIALAREDSEYCGTDTYVSMMGEWEGGKFFWDIGCAHDIHQFHRAIKWLAPTGPSWTMGRFGSALELDNISDYVEFENGSSMDFGSDVDFSLSLWANFKSYPPVAHKDFIGTIHNTPLRYGFELGFGQNNVLRFYITDGHNSTYGNNSQCYSSFVPNLGEWYHLVFVADRDANGTLYLNGESICIESIEHIGAIKNYPLRINHILIDYIEISIDEISLHRRSLSSEEIKALYNNGVYRLYYNFTGLSERTYEYSVWAADEAGDCVNTPTRSIMFAVDESPPEVRLLMPLNTTYSAGTSVTLNFTYTEDNPGSCIYNLDGSGNNTINYTNGTFLTNTGGYHTLLFWCNDSIGTWGSNHTGNFTITVTSTPSVGLVSPVDGEEIGEVSPIFGFRVSDTDNEAVNCTLYVDDVPLASNVDSVADGSTINNIEVPSPLSYDDYLWYVSCTDGSHVGVSSVWELSVQNETSEGEDNVTNVSGGDNGTVSTPENTSNETVVSPGLNDSVVNQSVGASICGNGVREEGEQCDGVDGVPEGDYWCSEDCELQFSMGQVVPSLSYEREIDIGVAKINMFFFLAVAIVLFVIIIVALVIYSSKTLKRRAGLVLGRGGENSESRAEEDASEEELEKPSVPSLDDFDAEGLE